MKILPRKKAAPEKSAQEVDPGVERQVHRRTEMTVERETVSVLLRVPTEVNAERKSGEKGELK